MAKESIGGTISSTTTFVGLSSILQFTGMPGQMGVLLRYVTGGTLEIGGASLSWGQGMVVSANAAAAHIVLPIFDGWYAAATGATVTITFSRIVSHGNPGSLG